MVRTSQKSGWSLFMILVGVVLLASESRADDFEVLCQYIRNGLRNIGETVKAGFEMILHSSLDEKRLNETIESDEKNDLRHIVAAPSRCPRGRALIRGVCRKILPGADKN